MRFLVGIALGASACGQSSSPVAPAPTGPSPTFLVVTGAPSAVAIGQTVALTAMLKSNGVSTDVTAAATWQSSDEHVAVVTAAGALRTVALGSASISAGAQGLTGSARLVVSVGSGPIASCVGLTGSGSFTLDSDIPAVSAPCLSFTGGASGSLDCQGHDAGSITLTNVQSFTVHDCVMHGSLDNGGSYRNLSISGGTNITLDRVDVAGSTFVGCDGCTLSKSTFVYPPSGHGAKCTVIWFSRGHDNALIDSTIDGGWDGNTTTWGTQGCDDGVVLSDAVRPVIQGNVIRHMYDSGVEAVGSSPVPGAIIRDNTIGNAGYAGIGGWYVAGWQDSVFSGNTISDSPELMTLFVDPIGAKTRGYVISQVSLLNNQFLHNTFLRPAPQHYGGYGPSAYVDMNSNFVGIVDNNVVRGNNFGLGTAGPSLEPYLGFVDGGDNICQPTRALASCRGFAGSDRQVASTRGRGAGPVTALLPMTRPR